MNEKQLKEAIQAEAIKVGPCKVCGLECLWLCIDGVLFEKEVCSYECLEKLNNEP
jgi:hypothetical protein